MADLPRFYLPQIPDGAEHLSLPDDTARHIGQVLRMQTGEEILLTDGKGLLAQAELADAGKRKVSVRITNRSVTPKPVPDLHLAIGFTKNASRNEWLLEKATELGIQRITPLITARGQKERIRPDRWLAILVSAMIQSQQSWLPELDNPTTLEELLRNPHPQRLFAHCMDEAEERTTIIKALKPALDTQILIGPEGDFTPSELTLAMASGAIPVSLGNNRLRTETAALSAITYFYLLNHAS